MFGVIKLASVRLHSKWRFLLKQCVSRRIPIEIERKKKPIAPRWSLRINQLIIGLYLQGFFGVVPYLTFINHPYSARLEPLFLLSMEQLTCSSHIAALQPSLSVKVMLSMDEFVFLMLGGIRRYDLSIPAHLLSLMAALWSVVYSE